MPLSLTSFYLDVGPFARAGTVCDFIFLSILYGCYWILNKFRDCITPVLSFRCSIVCFGIYLWHRDRRRTAQAEEERRELSEQLVRPKSTAQHSDHQMAVFPIYISNCAVEEIKRLRKKSRESCTASCWRSSRLRTSRRPTSLFVSDDGATHPEPRI
ncbi:hypothetical protein QBC43DRAFT_294053 [Cladorrhinum sp. PSN259]|nr:hypothetical protein QBC43DRAFT_294053 [Cladorrhinum sp. PSN259]